MFTENVRVWTVVSADHKQTHSIFFFREDAVACAKEMGNGTYVNDRLVWHKFTPEVK